VLIFFSKKYAICRKNTKRIDQAALPLASIMVTLRVYKMGSDIVTQNLGNYSSELKGSYLIVNRMLYRYICNYATFFYEKEKYAAWKQKYCDSLQYYFS
jgi:hypothetical protein